MTRFTFEYEGEERIPVRCKSAKHGVPVSDAMWARYQSARMEFEACLRLMEEVADRHWKANPQPRRPLVAMASAGVAYEKASVGWPTMEPMLSMPSLAPRFS